MTKFRFQFSVSSKRPTERNKKMSVYLGILWTVVSLCCFCLGIPFGCAAESSNEEDAVVVAALLPFTGDLSAYGTNYERALLLAADRINEAGGIGGKPLRLVSADTHSDPKKAVEALDALASRDIAGVIGPDGVDITLEISASTDIGDLTQIIPAITAPVRSAGRTPDADWFHIAPGPELFGCVLGQQVYDDGGARLIIINQNDTFFSNMASAAAVQYNSLLVPETDAHRATAVSIPFQPGQNTYLELVSQAIERQPDSVVLLAHPETAAKLVNAWSASGGNPKWYLAPTLETDVFLANSPSEALEGSFGVGAELPSDRDTFASEYSKMWSGSTPVTASYFYYDALVLFALSYEAAYREHGGPPNKSLIQEFITSTSRSGNTEVGWNEVDKGLSLVADGEEINYRGASGNMDLEDTGELSDSDMARYWRIKGGRIVSGESIGCR